MFALPATEGVRGKTNSRVLHTKIPGNEQLWVPVLNVSRHYCRVSKKIFSPDFRIAILR
jgi:hypothetical protein